MSKPIVAIVGRPNVGKSSLFNRLIGRRAAIVEDTPGVTRDRIYADAEWLNYSFTIVDTGGIEPENESDLSVQMRRQAELAIETADVILFLADGREGLTASDRDVAELLRKSKKKVVLAVNKVDAPKYEDIKYDFYELGFGEPFTISAEQGLGLGDLLDDVVSGFSPVEADTEEKRIDIAVIGRPNVGKSSLVNALLGERRSIVSDVPGTTRDSLDTPFSYDGKEFTIIDTAGIRRKRAIEDCSIERYSVIRSLAAIRRSNIVIILVDASQGLSEQDVRLAGYAHEEGKASLLIVNKWDLIEKDTYTSEQFRKKFQADLAFMSYVPMLFVSAKTGQRVDRILDLAVSVYEESCRRVTTGALNDIVNEAVMVTEPPSDNGRRLRVYYSTQVSVQPPTFVIFVNDPDLVHFSYARYLENYIRKSFQLTRTPLRLLFRSKKKGD